MSAEQLTLKYRPCRFEEIKGQDVLVTYCATLIQRGQQGRNLLISGPYGSGKTTTARIYAQALHCVAPEPGGSPCHKCDSCAYYQTDTISHPDYMEFDGASKGRIEQMKEIADLARQPPLFSRFRIIIIDEAQGVSRQAFDALLKVVEEPPPWVVFIFLTTEKDKIREAIKSRCQDLEVKLLDAPTAVAYLKEICRKEDLAFEDNALELIAFLAKGHSRDLLKNLDQVSVMGVTLDNVKQTFSLGYIQTLVKYVQALLEGNIDDELTLLRDWHDTPSRKFQAIYEFLLFVYYREVLHIPVTVNPAFDFVPEADRRRISNGFAKKAENAAVDKMVLWQKLTDYLSTQRQPSIETQLDFMLIHLHHLVNTNNFTSSKLPTNTSLQKQKLVPSLSARTSRQMHGIPSGTVVDPATFVPATQSPLPPATQAPPPPATSATPPSLASGWQDQPAPLQAPPPAPAPAEPTLDFSKGALLAPNTLEPPPLPEGKVYGHHLPMHGLDRIVPSESITLDDYEDASYD